MMTRALHKLCAEGVPIEPETVAAINPPIRAHIGRFGRYTLDLSRQPEPINYELPIFTNGTSATVPARLSRARGEMGQKCRNRCRRPGTQAAVIVTPV